MEGLGRLFNLVPTADGIGVSLKGATAVTFVGVGADTYTVTVADSFSGSYATPGDILEHHYANSAANGSAAWTKTTLGSASNAVTIASGVTAFTVDANSLPDDKVYVKCTSTSTGLVYAIVHDLTVQRAPANLPALGA